MQVLDNLPVASSKRIAVRVTPAGQREIRKGHPWLFDGSITEIGEGARPGDLAVVFDDRRDFLAIGLYDPGSPIRVRILHRGKPTTIDAAWWQAQIDHALARRTALLASGQTTAARLINGENDGFSGLVVDRYESVLVVKIYSEAWLAHLRLLIPMLVDATEASHVVIRLARNLGRVETFGLFDGLVFDARGVEADPAEVEPQEFRENGLTFQAFPVSGQKTGHFLDQRRNRSKVRALAEGRRVLDVFCCTGGFSVHAAAGGATLVHSVDIAPGAVEATRTNLALNGYDVEDGSAFASTIGDAFEVMADLAASGAYFDLIVVDPPSFAQKQADIDRAVSAYRKLTHLALGLLAPDGILVQASCSSRVEQDEFVAQVLDTATQAGRPLHDVEVTGHDVDHPVSFAEGAYLKAVFGRVD